VVTASGTTLSLFVESQVLGFRDAIMGPLWQSAALDLTPYIAGGSGPKQNEFNMNGAAVTSSVSAVDGNGTVPCAFVYAGQSSDTNTHGKDVAVAVITMKVDLLDFTAVGMTNVTPVGVPRLPAAQSSISARSDVKEPVDKKMLSSDDSVLAPRAGRGDVSPTPSFLEKVVKATSATRYFNPPEQAARAASVPTGK
jgi:hypothetical protein